MRLQDLEIYNISMEVSDKIWTLVAGWDNFAKYSIGNQVTRSSDSVSANISEGYGRFHLKDRRRFYYFARGSLFETITWISKSYKRNLISEKDYQTLQKELKNLSVKLNNYVTVTNRNIKMTEENSRKQ